MCKQPVIAATSPACAAGREPVRGPPTPDLARSCTSLHLCKNSSSQQQVGPRHTMGTSIYIYISIHTYIYLSIYLCRWPLPLAPTTDLERDPRSRNTFQFPLPLSTFTFHFPLSTFRFPLSTFHFPLSTFHFPLSTFHCIWAFPFPLLLERGCMEEIRKEQKRKAESVQG